MKKLFLLLPTFLMLTLINTSCDAANPSSSREFKHALTKGTPDMTYSGKLEQGVRTVEVKASRYKFEPDPIVVKKGEKVRLVVTSLDTTHGLAIAEFGVNLPVEAGKTATVEFTADKEGTFVTHCSVYCGMGHARMQGHLIVQ